MIHIYSHEILFQICYVIVALVVWLNLLVTVWIFCLLWSTELPIAQEMFVRPY